MMKVPASKWWLYKHCAPPWADTDPVRRAAASRDSFMLLLLLLPMSNVGLRRDELREEMLCQRCCWINVGWLVACVALQGIASTSFVRSLSGGWRGAAAAASRSRSTTTSWTEWFVIANASKREPVLCKLREQNYEINLNYISHRFIIFDMKL